MFTGNAVQREVMCMMDQEMCMDMCMSMFCCTSMMDKEMRMYMCMSNCALMYRKLPVASADQSNAV